MPENKKAKPKNQSHHITPKPQNQRKNTRSRNQAQNQTQSQNLNPNPSQSNQTPNPKSTHPRPSTSNHPNKRHKHKNSSKDWSTPFTDEKILNNSYFINQLPFSPVVRNNGGNVSTMNFSSLNISTPKHFNDSHNYELRSRKKRHEEDDSEVKVGVWGRNWGSTVAKF